MPLNKNPNSYPIKQAQVGSQYKQFFAETENQDDIVDFSTVPAMQYFSNSTGLSNDIAKLDAEYYSVPTPIKFNGATTVAGDQTTFATPTGTAYIVAKTVNNYVTADLDSGICLFTSVVPSWKMTATRTGTEITNLAFEIGTTTFSVDLTSTTTIAQAIELINSAAPIEDNRPIMSVRLWVGDDSTIFNLLPTTDTVFEYTEKVALVDTHTLTDAEKNQYPKKITIVYPSLVGNNPQYYNVLLYNQLAPEFSLQFYGVRNKGFTLTFANNGLTNFTFPQIGVGVVAGADFTNLATPKYVDEYQKIYSQSTYNTAPYWDGVYAGAMTDCTCNIEYDLADAFNITGMRINYPNAKYGCGVTGGAVLNETAYQQFFTDMVDNRTPSFVLESVQYIEGVNYQMLWINNFINGKPSPFSVQPGALSFEFPSDAVGQVDVSIPLSNNMVFLHDEIPDFESNT